MSDHITDGKMQVGQIPKAVKMSAVRTETQITSTYFYIFFTPLALSVWYIDL